jgi:hypothetical protein
MSPVATEASNESLLFVGVDSWIIQDSNYDDFTVGQHAKFALEFWASTELRPAGDGPLGAEHVGAARYRVRARIVFANEGVWVLDAGRFLTYSSPPPQKLRTGQLVGGDINLGVDPFFYFEKLHRLPGMPPLSYRWRIREIQRETTPWIDGVLESGTQVRTRDESRESFAQATATDAWHDDGGHGHYVLGCLGEGGPGTP